MARRVVAVTLSLGCTFTWDASTWAQGKPGATENVYLDVSLSPVSGAGIMGDSPDGSGLYPHGVKGISAFFNGDGELIFRIDSKASPRRVRFEYGPPYEQVPADARTPVSGNYADATSLLTTVAVRRDVTYVRLQDLASGGVECVQLQWGYTDGAKTFWSHNFHRPQSAGADIDVSQTAYGVVTCTSAADGNCMTWVVEPRAGNTGLQCEDNGSVPGLARLIDRPARGDRNDSGLHVLPFKLTLTRR